MTRTARTDEFVALPAELAEIRQVAITGLDAGMMSMLDPKRLEQLATDPEIRDALEQYITATARLARVLGLDADSIVELLNDLEDI